MPLVFPSFVGAAAFIAGLAPDGVDPRACSRWSATTRRDGSAASGASCLVLTAFTYPYVYLPVAARLAGLPPSIEESARLLGDRPSRLFFRVVLPAIRSSVLGGMLIVLLYSLSEFGAVQLLGFDTLTRVVYATRLLDRAQSFAAATLLLVLAVVAVTIERRLRGSLEHSAPTGLRRNAPIRLGRWRITALVSVVAVLLVSLGRARRLARAVGVARHRRTAGPPSPSSATSWSSAARPGLVDGVARHRRRRRRCRGGAPGRAADCSLPQPTRLRRLGRDPRRLRRARDSSSRSASRSGRSTCRSSIGCYQTTPLLITGLRRPLRRAGDALRRGRRCHGAQSGPRVGPTARRLTGCGVRSRSTFR